MSIIIFCPLADYLYFFSWETVFILTELGNILILIKFCLEILNLVFLFCLSVNWRGMIRMQNFEFSQAKILLKEQIETHKIISKISGI